MDHSRYFNGVCYRDTMLQKAFFGVHIFFFLKWDKFALILKLPVYIEANNKI